MRYYSEDTVKRMLLSVAHTALEQRAINNGDVFFRQPSIELPDKHGRLIDEDALGLKDEWALVETGRIWNAPTVLEANYQQVNSKQ